MNPKTYGDSHGHPGCHGCQICWANDPEIQAALDDPASGEDSIFDAADRAKFDLAPTDEELAFWKRVVETDGYPEAVDEIRMIHEIRRLRAENARLAELVRSRLANVPCRVCHHDPERGRSGADD